MLLNRANSLIVAMDSSIEHKNNDGRVANPIEALFVEKSVLFY